MVDIEQRKISPKEEYCYSHPIVNYSTYDVFCIKTKLYHYIHNKYTNYYLNIANRVDNGIAYLTYTLYNDKDQPINDIQLVEEIKKIESSSTKNYCLVFSADFPVYYYNSISNTEEVMDSAWVRAILPYVSITPIVLPYHDKGNIYVYLGRWLDYEIAYNILVRSIQRQLEYMYMRGYIVNPPPSLTTNWELEQISKDTSLWRAKWKDLRWGPISKVLQSQIWGDPLILTFKPNLVRIYYIKQELDKLNIRYTLSFNKVYYWVDSLSAAQTVANTIQYVESVAVGVAVLVDSNSGVTIRQTPELTINIALL